MINIKRMLIAILLLPAISCEHSEGPEIAQEEGAPVTFLLNTKSLQEGEHTYRVLFSLDNAFYQGTYCNEIITPGSGIMGSWLSPCNVDKKGNPADANGHAVESIRDADKESKYGLYYRISSAYADRPYFSVISPAVEVKKDGNRPYLEWNSEETVYISNSLFVIYEGSWIRQYDEGNKLRYVYNPNHEENKDNLKLIDRRSKLFITLECGEQEQTDLQKVQLTSVNTARWYFPGGIETQNYTTKTTDLFNYETSGSIPLHLIKDQVSWTNEEDGGDYVLALDYASLQYQTMTPKLVITLGSDTPIEKVIDLSQNLEPMYSYKLSVKISSTNVIFKLLAKPWYGGGSSETEEEDWATVAVGGNNTWEPGGTIGTDDWNKD